MMDQKKTAPVAGAENMATYQARKNDLAKQGKTPEDLLAICEDAGMTGYANEVRSFTQQMENAEGGTEEKPWRDMERLELAYCRAICFEWDELFGEKPKGFDEMPNLPELKDSLDLMKRDYLTKFDFLHPAEVAIEEIIGKANASRCWWKCMKLGSEEEWFCWYLSTKGLTSEQVVRRKELLEEPPKQCPKGLGKKSAGKGSKNGKHPFVATLSALLVYALSFALGCIDGRLLFELLKLL